MNSNVAGDMLLSVRPNIQTKSSTSNSEPLQLYPTPYQPPHIGKTSKKSPAGTTSKKSNSSSTISKASSRESPSINYTRSGSNESVYSDIIKDIRIVHPSMQKASRDENDAVMTSDESEVHSLFLSSFSSHSASTDPDH